MAKIDELMKLSTLYRMMMEFYMHVLSAILDEIEREERKDGQ